MTEELKPWQYAPIALSNESTVVAEFERQKDAHDARYQSEAELERDFIERLQVQAYEYLPFTSEAELVANLRRQLEALNRITFSDAEWSSFFTGSISIVHDGLSGSPGWNSLLR